jgi:hypothetical protein
VTKNSMAGDGGGVVADGDDQFAAPQVCDSDLNCTFGKACRVGKRSQTRNDRSPFLPHGLAVKIQINQISRWMLIVSDQIAHQDIQNVIVNGNGLLEARHSERMKEEGRRMK